MRKQLLLTICFCCVAIFAFSQGKLAFTAQLNAKKVVKGGFFQIDFKVENGALDNFKPPKFNDFIIISGPSRRSEISIVNGKRSQVARISYGLSSNKIGNFKIGSASITIKGKTYRTAPLTIEVVKGSDKKGTAERQFVRFDVDLTEAYVGQQIVGELKVYSQDRILNAELLSLPEIPSAYSEPLLGQNDILSGQDVINGKQYNTYTLQKYAIFPQKAGEITIEPISAYLETLGNQSGFIRQLRYNLSTEFVSLDITNLENQPEDFSEGIGKFNFEVILNKEKLSTDETTILILNIIGTGDMKRIQPLELNGLKDYFDIYEPTTETKLVVQNGLLIGQKLITYVLAPKKAGRFQFSQDFTYFDTDVNNFISLNSDTFNLVITQGEKIATTTEDFSQQDIYPILTKENRFLNWNFFGSTLFWILLTLPFAALMILLIIKKQKRKAAEKAAISQISAVDKIALARLEQAKIHLEAQNQRLFYNEINQSLFGYVSDKFSIPFSELSKDNIRLKLEEQQIETTTVDKFINILNTCELALFAGIGKAEDMQTAYDNAKSVIVEIEK
jgi:hypothetical protein